MDVLRESIGQQRNGMAATRDAMAEHNRVPLGDGTAPPDTATDLNSDGMECHRHAAA